MRPTAIVIPSYGRPDLLRRTLQSLVDAQWPPSFTGVWVVENGPQTGLEAVCADVAAHLPLHYVHAPQLGLSAARNAGARACEGEVILFTGQRRAGGVGHPAHARGCLC